MSKIYAGRHRGARADVQALVVFLVTAALLTAYSDGIPLGASAALGVSLAALLAACWYCAAQFRARNFTLLPLLACVVMTWTLLPPAFIHLDYYVPAGTGIPLLFLTQWGTALILAWVVLEARLDPGRSEAVAVAIFATVAVALLGSGLLSIDRPGTGHLAAADIDCASNPFSISANVDRPAVVLYPASKWTEERHVALRSDSEGKVYYDIPLYGAQPTAMILVGEPWQSGVKDDSLAGLIPFGGTPHMTFRSEWWTAQAAVLTLGHREFDAGIEIQHPSCPSG